MTRVNLIATACFTAMLAVLTFNVAAQDFNTNERTYLTFSSAVELPGVTLQPGTYLFKLADSPSNRHIVQVFNQDESKIQATILAVPAERLEVTGETVVTFRETTEGATPAVQYWYYPGDRIGHEFVYPKDQAMTIAKRTGQDVLTMDGEVASSGTKVSSVNPEGQMSEWKREDAPAPTEGAQAGAVAGTTGVSRTPRESEETVAPREETRNPETETPPAEPSMPPQSRQPAASQPTDTAAQPSELPRTASQLPLGALIGLLSLGGALALRRAR